MARSEDSVASSGKLVVSGGVKCLRRELDDFSNMSCIPSDAGLSSQFVDLVHAYGCFVCFFGLVLIVF